MSEYSPTGMRVGLISVLLIAAMLVMQGGYFGFAANLIGLLAGIVAIIVAIVKIRDYEWCGILPILFVALAILYLISAAVTSQNLTAFAEAGAWAGVAAIAMLSVFQCEEGRKNALDALAWVAIGLCAVGIFMWAGIIPFDDINWSDRLCLTLQYPNTAGSFIVAAAILAVMSERSALRAFVPILFMALFLNSSAGALLVFALAAVALIVMWTRSGEFNRINVAVFQVVLAGAAFVVIYKLGYGNVFDIIPMLVLAVVCGVSLWKWEEINDLLNKKVLSIVLIALAILGFLALAVMLFGGDAQAKGNNFLERFCHMKDAFLVLFGTNPVLGAGPDQWQFIFHFFQTAVYQVSAVHNSYLQIMVDTGLIGLLLIVAIVILGIRSIIKAEDHRVLIAFCAMALHAFIDLDFCFASMAMIFAFLACGTDQCMVRATRAVPTLIASVLCCAMSAFGLYCIQTKTAIEDDYTNGVYQKAIAEFEDSTLAQNDSDSQLYYTESLGGAGGMLDKAKSYYDELGLTNETLALYVARVNYALGDAKAASKILVDIVEAQPLNREILDTIVALIDENGLDNSEVERYYAAIDAAVEKSNQGLNAVRGLAYDRKDFEISNIVDGAPTGKGDVPASS